MEIAPGIKASDWSKLELDEPSSDDWTKAIDFFKNRILQRYIEPVNILLKHEDPLPAKIRKYGFTILAIDCLLIETLQAFREGLIDTKGKSREMFKSFLTKRPRFKEYFDKDLAEKFYEDYRCGILHQAEIKGDSIVWSVGELISNSNGKMTVNRSEFHKRLREEFESYIQELNNMENQSLRESFKKKMNNICRIEHFSAAKINGQYSISNL